MNTPSLPPGVLAYLRETYDPLAILLYGSYADGTRGPSSDLDALVLTSDGPAHRDVSVVDGVQLDVFIYPRSHFGADFDPGELPQLAGAVVLLDRDGLGLALKERAADWLARRPVKSLDELRVQTAWCRKMLRRTQRGDAEGLFRLHWLLTDSLEICCDLLGRPYQGPKKSLRWLAEARPEGYAFYTAALASPSPAALERWVSWLEAALEERKT